MSWCHQAFSRSQNIFPPAIFKHSLSLSHTPSLSLTNTHSLSLSLSLSLKRSVCRHFICRFFVCRLLLRVMRMQPSVPEKSYFLPLNIIFFSGPTSNRACSCTGKNILDLAWVQTTVEDFFFFWCHLHRGIFVRLKCIGHRFILFSS